MGSTLTTDLKGLNHRGLWKPFMEKYGCQIICEVGVKRGENLKLMTEHRPKIAVAVDTWTDDGVISRNDMGITQLEFDKQYEDVRRLAAERPCVEIYREYSVDAARHFSDNYFDLIYIDADHTYKECLKDIESWFPKVKKGRFLMGDDYRELLLKHTGIKFGVVPAVKKFAKENNLTIHELPLWGWAVIK